MPRIRQSKTEVLFLVRNSKGNTFWLTARAYRQWRNGGGMSSIRELVAQNDLSLNEIQGLLDD